MFYVNTLGFLAPPGDRPLLHSQAIIDLVHLTSAPPWTRTMEQLMNEHTKFVGELERQNNRIVVVHSTRDMLYLRQTGKIGCILGLQCPPDDATTEDLYNLGIRITTLAYDKQNAFGGGWQHDDGLTVRGVNFVWDCLGKELIVDLSHAGHVTARQVLDQARHFQGKVPIMASHGGCYSVYPHARNLPDDVLRNIADMGGIVGIATLTFILDTRDNRLAPFVRHLKHALDVCGEDAVAIGGDGWYDGVPLDRWKEHVKKMRAALDPEGIMGARFPDQPFDLNTPERMVVILRKLEREGLSPRLIEKVMGENALTFFTKAL